MIFKCLGMGDIIDYYLLIYSNYQVNPYIYLKGPKGRR